MRNKDITINKNKELSPENLIYITTQRLINQRSISLMAERILMSIASQITLEDIEDLKNNTSNYLYTYTIDLKIFAELFGYSTIKFRTKLKEARDELSNLIITFPTTLQAQVGVISFSIIKNNRLMVQIHPYMLPFYAMKGQAYELANILSFQNPYTFKFYEIFLSALEDEDFAYLTMSIEEIKTALKLENKYPLYANFKDRILKSIIQDINKENKNNLCNITIDFEEIKENKKVKEIKFTIKRKKLNQSETKNLITISGIYQELSPKAKEAYNFFLKEAKQGSGFLDRIITENSETFIIETYNAVMEQKKQNKIQHLNSYCGTALKEKWFINTLSDVKNKYETINAEYEISVLKQDNTENKKQGINNELMNKFMKLTKIQQEFIYNQLINNSDNLWYTQRLKNVSLDEMLQDISKKSQFKVLLNKDPKVLEFLNSIELKED